MTAATNMMMMKECFLYAESSSEDIIPSFVNANAITGSWKTTPISNVKVVNVEMYESRVMVLCIFSATLYVPKNLNEMGKIT